MQVQRQNGRSRRRRFTVKEIKIKRGQNQAIKQEGGIDKRLRINAELVGSKKVHTTVVQQ